MAKQVTDREHSAEYVATAADTHRARIQKLFEERFSPFLHQKETMPDIGSALTLVARALRAQSQELIEKSRKHDAELADDDAPRKARDSATAELIALLVGIRSTIEAVYGKAGLKALGIDGRTPTDSKAVFEHARKLVHQLEDAALKWPKPVQKGIKVDTKVWIAELKKPLARLEAARKDVAREEREAQLTSDEKSKAMASYDELFQQGAGFIASALALIGDHELSGKVRPSPRRPGTATVVEESSSEEPSDGNAGGESEPT